MSIGFQIRDEQGRVILDTTSYTFKTTEIDIGTVTSPGSIDLSALTSMGVQVTPMVQVEEFKTVPLVTVDSSGVVSWQNRRPGDQFARTKISLSLI